jgi:hypothetical protein
MNEKGEVGQRPLSLALVKELLLEQNDVDLESKDKDGRTAPLCATGGWVKFKDFA